MPSCLEKEDLKNSRPFISKPPEKVVAKRIQEHTRNNDLHESCQSAYRKDHSIETFLLKVHGDTETLYIGPIVARVLINLSAEFDVTDHATLSKRLELSLDEVISFYQRHKTAG